MDWNRDIGAGQEDEVHSLFDMKNGLCVLSHEPVVPESIR